jgi:hypothetical protein
MALKNAVMILSRKKTENTVGHCRRAYNSGCFGHFGIFRFFSAS